MALVVVALLVMVTAGCMQVSGNCVRVVGWVRGHGAD